MPPSILIVAAERGLGLGLAQVLFDRGWSVTGTAIDGADTTALAAVGATEPARLTVVPLDVRDAGGIDTFIASLGERRYDVIYFNAGVWGPLHQSIVQATDAELADIMSTNAFGPIRLAHRLVGHLTERGTVAFMSSYRGSVALNLEGGLEPYRASKAAQNMLARGLHAQYADRRLTVLSIHPGWVRTAMGTLNGTVEPEIELDESLRGIVEVLETHRGSGENVYVDWRGERLPW